MTDHEQLRAYYASFMENLSHAEPLVWVQIQQRTITKADFVAAMRRWAEDIVEQEGGISSNIDEYYTTHIERPITP